MDHEGIKTRTKQTIRIGGASGFWGDSQVAPRQLVMTGDIDYLVFDYLAEVTMSILVRARERNPAAGYARDFVDLVMKPLLPEIKARGIKVIANAGGINPGACAAALAEVAKDAGIELKIGIVEGDDLIEQAETIKNTGTCEMFSGAPWPDSLISANAYLGAFPIAAALDAGAEVVITGRCVDSAVTLAALVHEFGWEPDDFDHLAAGTLAGHVIECGTQATGGNFTDWRDVVEGWDNMGYPIAECRPDGSFTICKPEDTGGLISRLSVGEQILYEIGDPSAYVVPDVICDFTQVELKQSGPNRLSVAGVTGRPPTQTYKVSATYRDGYRSSASTIITGFEAVEKGGYYARALLKRTRRLFAERDLGDYRNTAVHLIGAQTLWGANADSGAAQAREITVRIDVRHEDKAALELFSKEATGVSLSMMPGRCTGGGGRPKITPVIAQFAFLIDKSAVNISVQVDGLQCATAVYTGEWSDIAADQDALPDADNCKTSGKMVKRPLIDLAVARSGDKGDSANIGVIARSPELLPYIRASLDVEKVRDFFGHFVTGEVSRYDLPGMDAMNFLLTQCLDGGGTSSLHLDSQAKTYAQQLLTIPVSLPKSLATDLKRQVARENPEMTGSA